MLRFKTLEFKWALEQCHLALPLLQLQQRCLNRESAVEAALTHNSAGQLSSLSDLSYICVLRLLHRRTEYQL